MSTGGVARIVSVVRNSNEPDQNVTAFARMLKKRDEGVVKPELDAGNRLLRVSGGDFHHRNITHGGGFRDQPESESEAVFGADSCGEDG